MSSGIEVQLYSAASLSTRLDILNSASSVTWQDVLGDVGSGSLVISIYDPKATVANLAKFNLVKVALNGSPVFGWFVTAPLLTMAEGEQSTWTLAGVGVLSYLARAAVYPASWGSAGTYPSKRSFTATAGSILNTLLTEAQARGTIPSMTWDFTASADSTGTAWANTVTLDIQVGASMVDVAKKLYALGIGIRMDPNLVLHAYNPGAFGSNLTSTVVWQMGHHITGNVTGGGAEGQRVATSVYNSGAFNDVALVSGSGGYFTEASDATMTGDASIGRWELGVNFGSSNDPTTLAAVGTSQIALAEKEALAISVPINHGTTNGLYEPYLNYNPGDTIALNVPGQYTNQTFTIAALTIQQTEGADYLITADLGALWLDQADRLAQLQSSTSGTTSQVSGGVSGNLNLASPTSIVTWVAVQGGIGFQNSWVLWDAVLSPVQYAKGTDGWVRLRGMMKSGVVGSSALTLPAGLRPYDIQRITVVSNNAFGRIDIKPTGEVIPQSPSSNVYVSLDGVSFYVG